MKEFLVLLAFGVGSFLGFVATITISKKFFKSGSKQEGRVLLAYFVLVAVAFLFLPIPSVYIESEDRVYRR